MTEPRTEAGKRLLASKVLSDRVTPELRQTILDIEAEAALPVPALDAFVTCGIGGCDFGVERGEGRTMALHQSEDHPALPVPALPPSVGDLIFASHVVTDPAESLPSGWTRAALPAPVLDALRIALPIETLKRVQKILDKHAWAIEEGSTEEAATEIIKIFDREEQP